MNLFFSPFLQLMEAVRHSDESVKKTMNSSNTIKPMPKKMLVIITVEKGKSQGSNSK